MNGMFEFKGKNDNTLRVTVDEDLPGYFTFEVVAGDNQPADESPFVDLDWHTKGRLMALLAAV